MNSSNNPFNVILQDVIIRKFNGTDKMSVMPQVVEFVLYQSIFSAMLKADIVFNDTIGLMNNYPLSGEETIEVTIKQSGEEEVGTGQKEFTKTITFVISAINNILVADDGRTMSYAMELASYDAFTNAKTRVSHAYHEDIEAMIEEVYKNYIVKGRVSPKPKKLKIFKDTEKVRKLVIPNIKPFDAIAWLCKFAISKDPEKYYTHMFFETLENYTFKAMQKLTFRDLEDAAAIIAASKEKYMYVSNIELVKNNNPKVMESLKAQGFSEDRLIGDFKINKRYSALEKIVGGYFENELVEINMLKNDYKITKKELKYKDYEFNTINPGKGYNTAEYIENVKKEYEEPETSARIRYIINNYDDENQPSFRDKFGRSAMSFLAFQQVDISMAINTNLLMRPGDLIYVDLPEFHGFNENARDRYLTGFYIVSEIKTLIMQGGKSGMQVRINRDSFTRDLALKHNYQFDNPDPAVSNTNPMGPR